MVTISLGRSIAMWLCRPQPSQGYLRRERIGLSGPLTPGRRSSEERSEWDPANPHKVWAVELSEKHRRPCCNSGPPYRTRNFPASPGCGFASNWSRARLGPRSSARAATLVLETYASMVCRAGAAVSLACEAERLSTSSISLPTMCKIVGGLSFPS